MWHAVSGRTGGTPHLALPTWPPLRWADEEWRPSSSVRYVGVTEWKHDGSGIYSIRCSVMLFIQPIPSQCSSYQTRRPPIHISQTFSQLANANTTSIPSLTPCLAHMAPFEWSMDPHPPPPQAIRMEARVLHFMPHYVA